MSLPGRYYRACAEQVHARYNEWKTTTFYMNTHDRVTYMDTTLGAAVVYLPPVAESKGLQYYIMHWLGAPTITFQGRLDCPTIPTVTALALNSSVLFESDGQRWHVIA
jgi:hypothetical protein